MAKKKAKNQFELYAAYIAILLGLVGLLLYLFLPAATMTVLNTKTSYSGLNLIFGKSETVLGASVQVIEPSGMLIVAFGLAIGAIVVSFLVSRRGKKGGLFAFIAAGAFVVAAVFTFLSVTFGDVSADVFKLGVGAIIAGILYALSGAVLLVKALF